MKWTIETFKAEVEKNEGYKLLSTEYIGCHDKVKIKHEICGNEYEVTPTNFLAGRRCPKCAILAHNREIAKKKKLNKNKTTNDFKNDIKKLVGDEYILLEEFINMETPVNIKHNKCGKVYKVRPYNFINGRRCPVCSKKEGAEKHKMGIVEAKKRIEEKLGDDYEVLLKQEYVDNNTKIKVYHTKCGQLFEATPTNLLAGRGCSHCNKSIKYTTESYQKALGDAYTVLSEYKTNKDPIKIKHNKCGHIWTARALDILHPYNRDGKATERCPKCNKSLGISSGEKEVLTYLKEDLGIKNIKENDRTILNGKELDIYLPDFNLAIEFDGLYWHSEEFVDKDYHLNKTNECKNKGIRLIHLMEDEWENKKEIVKEKLKYMTNNSEKSIYARKCYIEEISSSDKNAFLEENHIQGKDSSSIKLGLWYPTENEDILVAVMTFCKPRLSLGQKNNKNNFDYELSRYATQHGFNVVGGFSKLFKYFERNYEWNNLITYADLRWSIGNLYLKNGFKLDHISKPSYSYIDKNNIKRYNRFKFRKQELKKSFPKIYSDDKTEFQIMKEAGFLKIYDCGNMVFYYNK